MKRGSVPRGVTAAETAVIEWLLDHAAVCDVAPYRTTPVAGLSVTGGCRCVCGSLDFHTVSQGPLTMLADALAIYPGGRRAGVILWGRQGEIATLELYGMDAVPNRPPRVSDLRRWEDLGS